MSPEQLLLVQHQAIKLVKSVSSITFEHWVQKEQFSELPRRCQESIRSIDLFAGPEDMFREACAHGTVNHIDANQIVTGSRLRTLGLHDVHIIQQGFSGLLRSSPGLRHLVLRDVTITSYNSSAELFTYLGVRNLEASLQQVWEHNSLTSAEYWCLLKHLPQLRKWMVLLDRDLLMRSVKGMDFEVVAFCPMLRSVDLDFLDPQSALLLLSRAFYMNRIKDCTMCICSMNEQLIQGLFLFNASLTSITITNDAVLGDDDDDDDDADSETIETDLDSTASRRFFLIPRSCPNLWEISIKPLTLAVHNLKRNCRELRVLRVRIDSLTDTSLIDRYLRTWSRIRQTGGRNRDLSFEKGDWASAGCTSGFRNSRSSIPSGWGLRITSSRLPPP